MRKKVFFLTGGILLAVCFISGLVIGAWESSLSEVWAVLTGKGDPGLTLVIRQIRLPRVLLGMFAGAGFAVSGAILQSMMNNPLVSPGIIGISAGGGLAGIIFMLIFPGLLFLQVPAAFAGAFASAMLVVLLAWKRGCSPIRLVLSGVAVSAMLGAFSSMILYLYSHKAGMVLEYTIGSLNSRGWPCLQYVFIYIVIALASSFLLARPCR